MTGAGLEILDRALLNLDAAIKVVAFVRAENFSDAAKYAEAQGSLAAHIERDSMALQNSIKGDERL